MRLLKIITERIKIMMKRIVTICIWVMMVVMTAPVFAADTVFINDDFEENNINNWLDGFRPHYQYGIKTIESDQSGKYIAFMPVNSSHYYIFEAKDIYTTSILYSQFDIKFPSESMEIQIRDTTSNLDVNFKMAGRIRKTGHILEYYSNGTWKHFLTSSGNWLLIDDVSKWYTIRMTFNVASNEYYINIEDRNNGNILSETGKIPFADNCNLIDYFAFSSQNKICLDNVKMFESNTGAEIEGRTYLRIPQNGVNEYQYNNRLLNGNSLWYGDIWTLDREIQGLSIDKQRGVLDVSSEARPGSAIIIATRKYCPWLTGTFLVDIDR